MGKTGGMKPATKISADNMQSHLDAMKTAVKNTDKKKSKTQQANEALNKKKGFGVGAGIVSDALGTVSDLASLIGLGKKQTKKLNEILSQRGAGVFHGHVPNSQQVAQRIHHQHHTLPFFFVLEKINLFLFHYEHFRKNIEYL